MSNAFHLSKTAEWGTPAQYLDAVRGVLRRIDLDPASNARAQQLVKACHWYTLDDDALEQEWWGRIYLNPPGDKSGRLVKAFWNKLVYHHSAGDVPEAIWCGFSLEQLSSLQGAAPKAPTDFMSCITDHRIRFLDADGKPGNQPSHANYFTLLSDRLDTQRRFVSHFGEELGAIVLPYH